MELSVQLKRKNEWTKRGDRVKINFHSVNEICVMRRRQRRNEEL